MFFFLFFVFFSSFAFKLKPNYKEIEKLDTTIEEDLERFKYYTEKNSRRADYNTIQNPGLISLSEQTEEQRRYALRYIFRNLEKNSARFITYPFPLTTQGGNLTDAIIDIDEGGIQSTSFTHLDQPEINFYKSKAIYDTNIAVLKMEIFENDVYKDLFYESDVYCTMLNTFLGHYGTECVTEDRFVPQTATRLVYLNASAGLEILETDTFKVLILPDIINQKEDQIMSFLDATGGTERIREYVRNGGFIYASGKSGVLLERIGIFETGVYNTNANVISTTNVASVELCDSIDKNQIPFLFQDFVKNMMCQATPNPQDSQCYMLSSYRIRGNIENYDSDIHPILYFRTLDTLKFKYVSNGITTRASNQPMVLYKQFGKGNVITMQSHPGFHSNSYPWFYNALFLGLGKNFVHKQSVDYSGGQHIPAMESGVQLTLDSAFYNIFDHEMLNFEMKFWIPKGMQIHSYNSDGSCIYSNETVPNSDLKEEAILCDWNRIDQYQKFGISFNLEINEAYVTQKKTDVMIAYTRVEYTNSRTNKSEEIEIGQLTVDTKIAALVRCSSNPDPVGFYPIKGKGTYVDNVTPCENKEDTEAIDVEHVAIVPIISPLLDGSDQLKVAEMLVFWNEYYDSSTNSKEDYVFPLKTLNPRDYDYLDFKFLKDKGVMFVADWDIPVKIEKSERDNSFPTMNSTDGNVNIPNAHYSTSIGSDGIVLKQIYFADSDIFFEHATQQLLVFIDPNDEKGAYAKWVGNIESALNTTDIDYTGSTKVRKKEYGFIRSDIYFYDSLDQYVIPKNIERNDVISIDRYPKYQTCKDSNNGEIMVQGYFDSTKLNGLKENEYGNAVVNRCDKNVIEYEDIETYTNGEVEKTRYLVPIVDDEVTGPNNLLNFDEVTGELKNYPEVKYMIGYSSVIILPPEQTRRGGKLVITVPYEFKSSDLGNAFYQADHIAFYDTKIDRSIQGQSKITSFFKRGLMPNENYGKDSIETVIFEDLNIDESIVSSFDYTVDIYELKYDITLVDNEQYYLRESRTLTAEKKQFFSLPAIKMKFKLNRTSLTGESSTSMLGYELIEPFARYGVYHQELLKHRTIWGNAESHLVSDPGLVSTSAGFAVISQVGISSIPFIDYLTVGESQLIPAGLETTRIEWKDIWNRSWRTPLRSVFPDVPPIPPPVRNFMMTTTFEVTDPVSGERVLEWDGETEMEIKVMMKLKNNYPKYFEITTCKNNEVMSITEKPRSRIFDPPPYSYQIDHVTDEKEYLSVGHRSFYGQCFDGSGEVTLSGQVLTSSDKTTIQSIEHCATTLDDTTTSQCIANLQSLPTISRRSSGTTPTVWNYAEEIENYYPHNYIKSNMWDLTHYDYDDNAFDKAYKYHMDNNLPSMDKTINKPQNIIAAPIFKGYGYQIEYSKDHTLKNYPNFKGWWSDNLQNKDHTILGGQSQSTDISVDKEYDYLIKNEDWIEITDLKDTGTSKYTSGQNRLKNIYTCLFNRHRIAMTTEKETNFQVQNIYQNNIVPIMPDLERNDERLTNYNCDLSVPQYTHQTISEVDNRVYTSDANDWLYFGANLRGNAFETINLPLSLTPFEDRKFEGNTKISQGGRYTYWNPCCGPNAFLIVDNPVNVIKTKRCDLELEAELFPKSTFTFNSEIYHLISIKDEAEIEREYTDSFYINQYGYGDIVTSIYVGGVEGSTAVIDTEEETYAKVSIYNNAGFDLNMKVGAIDFVYKGSMNMNADSLLNGYVHAIQAPISYNFLKLSIPSELSPYVTITPSQHNIQVAPLFFDFSNINVVSILDGFKGDYYFKITLAANIPDSLRGKLHEIGVSIDDSYFEHFPGTSTDLVSSRINKYQIEIPNISFGIPFGQNSPLKYQGKVYYNLGRSNDLRLTVPINCQFDILQTKFIEKQQIDQLRDIASNTEGVVLSIRSFFDALESPNITTTKIEEETNIECTDDSYWNYQFDINSYHSEFPNKEKELEPPTAEMYLLVKTFGKQINYGFNIIENNPKLEYNACKKTEKETFLATTPSYRSVTAKGPMLATTYNLEFEEMYKLIKGEQIPMNSDLLYPYSAGTMKIFIQLSNIGSGIAYNIEPILYFNSNFDILEDKFAPNDQGYSYSVEKSVNVNGINEVRIQTNYDLSPGDSLEFYVFVQFSPEAQLVARNDFENFPNSRVFVDEIQGKMDLTNVIGENQVIQSLDSISFPYTLREIDEVTLTGSEITKKIAENEEDENNCFITLTANANQKIVDGYPIKYQFFQKPIEVTSGIPTSDTNANSNDDDWEFIRASNSEVITISHSCYSTEFKVETIHGFADTIKLAEGKYEMNFYETLILSVGITSSVIIAIFAFLIIFIAFILIYTFAFPSKSIEEEKESPVPSIPKKKEKKESFVEGIKKFVFKGWYEAREEESIDRQYYVNGQMVNVVENVVVKEGSKNQKGKLPNPKNKKKKGGFNLKKLFKKKPKKMATGNVLKKWEKKKDEIELEKQKITERKKQEILETETKVIEQSLHERKKSFSSITQEKIDFDKTAEKTFETQTGYKPKKSTMKIPKYKKQDFSKVESKVKQDLRKDNKKESQPKRNVLYEKKIHQRK